MHINHNMGFIKEPKRDWIFVILILILILALSTMAEVKAQDFYHQLNAYRKAHGRRELNIDPTLETQSLQQLHKIKKIGLVHGSTKGIIGEVIAKNCDLECWIKSKPHRNILLSRKATRIGFKSVDGIAVARLSD